MLLIYLFHTYLLFISDMPGPVLSFRNIKMNKKEQNSCCYIVYSLVKGNELLGWGGLQFYTGL
jgi:hypothetical protein